MADFKIDSETETEVTFQEGEKDVAKLKQNKGSLLIEFLLKKWDVKNSRESKVEKLDRSCGAIMMCRNIFRHSSNQESQLGRRAASFRYSKN